MNSINTQIRLISLSLVALALLAFIALNWLKIKNENLETTQILIASGATEKAQREAQTIRNIQISAADDLEAFEKIILTDEKLVPLIENIEETSRILRLDLEITSVEKSLESEGEPQIIRMAINVEGAWSDIYNFLKAIESLPYRIMIEQVSLEKSGTKWSETLSFSIHSFK